MYVDGFVLPMPKKSVAAYREMAALGAKLWKKHGALHYYECAAEDLRGMPGTLSFTKLARLKSNETVFFSFIIFTSRAHRDAVNKKVMGDPVMAKMPKKMPFDPKRMAYGGFAAVVVA